MDQLEDEKALKMQRLCMFVSLFCEVSHGCVCIVTCSRFHALDLFTHVLRFSCSPSNAPPGMSWSSLFSTVLFCFTSLNDVVRAAD